MFKIKTKIALTAFSLLYLTACQTPHHTQYTPPNTQNTPPQYLVVLGIAQDGGYPHIGCKQTCCTAEMVKKEGRKKVVSLGLVDKMDGKKWLFEATPDMTEQLFILERHLKTATLIDGVFPTHAHIGHYAGLMYFGREALGGSKIPVFAMPKMQQFLKTQAPWSQLVSLQNIDIQPLVADSETPLSKNLKVVPFGVPHRDEFSETVGYKIIGKNKTAIFIPDIDKWQKWQRSIVAEVEKVDYAFLDATFFQNGEIRRPMSEVPHPFVVETAQLFEKSDPSVKSKIIFIHFNHTNPALKKNDPQKAALEKQGFRFAAEGQVFEL